MRKPRLRVKAPWRPRQNRARRRRFAWLSRHMTERILLVPWKPRALAQMFRPVADGDYWFTKGSRQ